MCVCMNEKVKVMCIGELFTQIVCVGASVDMWVELAGGEGRLQLIYRTMRKGACRIHHSPDKSDVWYSLLCFEMAQREAGSLSHNAVLVRQQLYEVVDNVVTGVPCTAEGDGGHCTDIGVLIVE